MKQEKYKLVFAVVVVLLSVTACKQEAAPPPAPPPPEVKVITVVPETIPDEVEFIGQTDSFRPVEIRSQVTGIIKKVFFTEGRDVKKAIGCISLIRFRLKLQLEVRKVKWVKLWRVWRRPERSWPESNRYLKNRR